MAKRMLMIGDRPAFTYTKKERRRWVQQPLKPNGLPVAGLTAGTLGGLAWDLRKMRQLRRPSPLLTAMQRIGGGAVAGIGAGMGAGYLLRNWRRRKLAKAGMPV